MRKNVLDALTAWHELARFAEVAGVELDERAHPDYDPKDEPEGEPEDESDVTDYSDLIQALRTGHADVGENGAFRIYWAKPPHKDRLSMSLDPEGGDGWPYGQATRALHTVPAPPAVSKAARKRTPSAQEDDKLGRMDRFLEILSGESPGTMIQLRNRRDRDLISALGGFVLLG